MSEELSYGRTQSEILFKISSILHDEKLTSDQKLWSIKGIISVTVGRHAYTGGCEPLPFDLTESKKEQS